MGYSAKVQVRCMIQVASKLTCRFHHVSLIYIQINIYQLSVVIVIIPVFFFNSVDAHYQEK